MGIRDLLKKKERLDDEAGPADAEKVAQLALPESTFIRSDTHGHEVIYPPNHPPGDEGADVLPNQADEEKNNGQYLTAGGGGAPKSRLSLDMFRGTRARSASVGSSKSAQSQGTTGSSSQQGQGQQRPSAARRISQRLHLNRAPSSSEVVPQDLPAIVTPDDDDGSGGGGQGGVGAESQWEARATMLARENEKHRSRPATPVRGPSLVGVDDERNLASPPPQAGVVSTKEIDDDIQEAIRLHESGDLARSTAMFGRLADPNGANNPLSQVLYGLALRHGWGCTPDPAGAVNYLSAAASNAASVESLALQAGLKKGGAAKGELVLAIFELANCFRHGWGISKDAIAAKQYYETAANLGDTDAMNEVAWCYLEGFGCKKDKFAAAKYYRLAEKNGNKTLGNTWIWKDKYDPGHAKR